MGGVATHSRLAIRSVVFGSLSLALLLAFALFSSQSDRAGATHVPLAEVAIDTDTTGNTATSVGTRESCSSIPNVGDTLQIDLYAKGVPPFDSNAFTDGVSGSSANLIYDPSIIRITAIDLNQLTAAAGPRVPFDVIDPLPDSDGNFRWDSGDLSTNIESGDGVVARITVQAVGAGGSFLHLDDLTAGDSSLDVIDAGGVVYSISNLLNDAGVVVGEVCGIIPTFPPTPTLSPTPTIAPTLTITPSPTPLPQSCEAPPPPPPAVTPMPAAPLLSVTSPQPDFSAALAWDGSALWVGGASPTIYRFDPYSATVLSSFPLPNGTPGLSWDGQHLWTIENIAPRAYLFKRDPSSGAVVGSLIAPFTGRITAAAWDGAYFWIARYDTGEIYQTDPSTGSVNRCIQVPFGAGMSLTGLAWDGEHLWAGYQGRGVIRKHDADTGAALSEIISPSGINQAGLAWDGQLWTAGGGKNILHRIQISPLVTPTPGPDPRTSVILDSEPGEPIVRGEQLVFHNLCDLCFQVGSFRSEKFRGYLQHPDHNFFLDFAAVVGSPLVPGVYENAMRFNSSTNPGLDISGDGAGCNSTTGRFVVYEADFDPNGNPLRFAADFEQHCDSFAPALFGGIRFNSTHPLRALSTSPTEVAFGSVPVGQSDIAQTISVRNTGSNTLHISSATVEGVNPADFSIQSDTCTGNALPFDSSCDFILQFTPTAGGSRTATLSISDDTVRPHRFIPLSGTGTAPTPTTTPTPTFTLTPTPTPTPTPVLTATPTTTPTPTGPPPHDASIARIGGLPHSLRLSPGEVISDTAKIVLVNDSNHVETVGLYVYAVPPGSGGCTPTGLVRRFNTLLSPNTRTTIQFAVNYTCANSAAADGLNFTFKAFADHAADDFAACDTLFEAFSGECDVALADDDDSDTDNARTRALPIVQFVP